MKTELVRLRIEPERKRRWREHAGGRRDLSGFVLEAVEQRIARESASLATFVAPETELSGRDELEHADGCKCRRCRARASEPAR